MKEYIKPRPLSKADAESVDGSALRGLLEQLIAEWRDRAVWARAWNPPVAVAIDGCAREIAALLAGDRSK